MLAKDAGRTYDNYGTIAQQLLADKPGLDAEAVFRQKMEKQMEAVKKAIKRLANELDSDNDDDVPLAKRMISQLTHIMQTPYGDRIWDTTTPLAKKVEAKVCDTIAQVAPSKAPTAVPGALMIK